jgi:EEF1A lysine methyltransferase 4
MPNYGDALYWNQRYS